MVHIPVSRMHRLLRGLARVCAAALACSTGLAHADSLRCPGSLSVSVNEKAYPGWEVYSNDPLRLTGADVSYLAGNEEATLDPQQPVRLNDDRLSTVSVYDLRKAGGRHELYLDCHYGIHAQLSRAIPPSMTECRVVHHGAFDDTREFEFEVGCE